MKIRRLVIVLFLPFLLSSFLLAQQETRSGKQAIERDPAKSQEQIMENLKQELSLSAEQESKVKELLDQRITEANAQREINKQKMEAQKEVRAERIKQAQLKQKEYNAKMKEILTQEQYIRFLELKIDKKHEFRNNKKMRHGNRKQNLPEQKPTN